MYFLSDEEVDCLIENGHSPVQPYKYIAGDEFSDHFPYTRPNK